MTVRKIMLFVPSFGGGGAERAILNLARGMKEIGHNVEIAVCRNEGEYSLDIPDDIEVVDLKSSRVLWGSAKLLLQVLIRRPDLVVSTLTHANIAVCFVSLFFPKRTKLVIRESSTPSVTKTEVKSRKVKFYLSLIPIAYKFAHKIAAVSNGVKQDLVANFNIDDEKIFIVKNPIVTPEVKALSGLDVDISITKRERFILAVGRLVEAKNFSMLIDAFYMASDRIPHNLIILGEGEQRVALTNKVASLGLDHRIFFPGFMSNPFAFMSKCDLFVLSSTREGFPNVLVQAAFCGAKVISTDCKSGPADFLHGEAKKYLVAVDDPKEMAEKIVDVILSHDRYSFNFDEFHYKSSALSFLESAFGD